MKDILKITEELFYSDPKTHIFAECRIIKKQFANKILGLSYMAAHWKKSKRQIYSWAADPDHCQVHYMNPLEKIKLMLMELKKKGEEDAVESALLILGTPLNYDISLNEPFTLYLQKYKSRILKDMLLEFAETAGFFCEYCEKKSKENISAEVYTAVKRIKSNLKRLHIALEHSKKNNNSFKK